MRRVEVVPASPSNPTPLIKLLPETRPTGITFLIATTLLSRTHQAPDMVRVPLRNNPQLSVEAERQPWAAVEAALVLIQPDRVRLQPDNHHRWIAPKLL